MKVLPDSLLGQTIAVLGGTGPQGAGLARRFALAGLSVVIGSRDPERASTTAKLLPGNVLGRGNEKAANAGDIVVVAVPWSGHRDLLVGLSAQLSGKVDVDCVNPLGFDKQGAFVLQVPEGSATEQAQAVLPYATVVGAFHNVSAALLADPEVNEVETDVLVLGDDRAAVDLIIDLAETIRGVRGIFGGRLRNARQIEALTANLISINRRYKAHAGVRVTDI